MRSALLSLNVNKVSRIFFISKNSQCSASCEKSRQIEVKSHFLYPKLVWTSGTILLWRSFLGIQSNLTNFLTEFQNSNFAINKKSWKFVYFLAKQCGSHQFDEFFNRKFKILILQFLHFQKNIWKKSRKFVYFLSTFPSIWRFFFDKNSKF